MPFLSLVTLTFDLDIQTPTSEGPSMFPLCIWRKSVQRFPMYFIHKQKITDSAKNRTLRNSMRAVNMPIWLIRLVDSQKKNRPSITSLLYFPKCLLLNLKHLHATFTTLLNITRSPAIAEGPRDAGVPVEIW